MFTLNTHQRAGCLSTDLLRLSLFIHFLSPSPSFCISVTSFYCSVRLFPTAAVETILLTTNQKCPIILKCLFVLLFRRMKSVIDELLLVSNTLKLRNQHISTYQYFCKDSFLPSFSSSPLLLLTHFSDLFSLILPVQLSFLDLQKMKEASSSS